LPAKLFLTLVATCLSSLAAHLAYAGTDDESSKTEDPAAVKSFWTELSEDTSLQRRSSFGLFMTQGNSGTDARFNPTREFRVSDKSKLVHGAYSLNWHLRLNVNRNIMRKDVTIDDPYVTKPLTLPNGSVFDKGYQFVVQEAYLQRSGENFLLQAGVIPHAWGSADTISPLTLFNPQDVRLGFLGDKELQSAPIPSVRLALLGDGSTLNFIYSPWRAATLQPMRGQNWYVSPDNFPSFTINYLTNTKVESANNFAVKYDLNVSNGDLSLIYYRGADYDFVGRPTGTRVENNQPIIIDIQQVTPEKTSLGASYSRAIDEWVIKGDALYTLDKKVMPEIDYDKIDNQSQVFPIELKSTPAYQFTVGLNYFASIKSFFGIPLSETVLIAEYYRQRFLKPDLTQPFLGDIVTTAARTTFLEGRLELLANYALDLYAKGSVWGGKLSFAGEEIKHSLTMQSFDGKYPGVSTIGSVFYYWRNNDFIAYEVSYQL